MGNKANYFELGFETKFANIVSRHKLFSLMKTKENMKNKINLIAPLFSLILMLSCSTDDFETIPLEKNNSSIKRSESSESANNRQVIFFLYKDPNLSSIEKIKIRESYKKYFHIFNTIGINDKVEKWIINKQHYNEYFNGSSTANQISCTTAGCIIDLRHVRTVGFEFKHPGIIENKKNLIRNYYSKKYFTIVDFETIGSNKEMWLVLATEFRSYIDLFSNYSTPRVFCDNQGCFTLYNDGNTCKLSTCDSSPPDDNDEPLDPTE